MEMKEFLPEKSGAKLPRIVLKNSGRYSLISFRGEAVSLPPGFDHAEVLATSCGWVPWRPFHKTNPVGGTLPRSGLPECLGTGYRKSHGLRNSMPLHAVWIETGDFTPCCIVALPLLPPNGAGKIVTSHDRELSNG
jgi:hypothetical protein